MREILFRGISRDTQTFVFGDLLQWKDGDCDICVNDLDTNEKIKCPVHSKTVGQFTGLYDKNGTKIFEGDILEIVTFGGEEKRRTVIGIGVCLQVEEDDEKVFAVYCDYFKKPVVFPSEHSDLVEIIGNIYDNPELLKENAG